jgi:hypothetical protein
MVEVLLVAQRMGWFRWRQLGRYHNSAAQLRAVAKATRAQHACMCWCMHSLASAPGICSCCSVSSQVRLLGLRLHHGRLQNSTCPQHFRLVAQRAQQHLVTLCRSLGSLRDAGVCTVCWIPAAFVAAACRLKRFATHFGMAAVLWRCRLGMTCFTKANDGMVTAGQSAYRVLRRGRGGGGCDSAEFFS